MPDKQRKQYFEKVIDSLKKFSRPELFEDGTDVLDELYTDLLPDDFILNKCLKERTTLLIGRKGTGKSTLFLKIENELNKEKERISCYIDTKTIYENVTNKPFNNNLDIDEEVFREYMVKRSFIKYILKDILEKLRSKIDESYFEKIKKSIGFSKKQDAIDEINFLIKKVEENDHLSTIEIPMLIKISKERNIEKDSSKEVGGGIKFSTNDAGLDISLKNINNEKSSNKDQYSKTLISVFDINGFIDKIKKIMLNIKIKKVFVLLDDFSEIDDPDINTFVDAVLMPLNNWSEQFFVFKIAAYPHRYYLGGIDQSKIDKVFLDFYNLHSKKDVKQMETSSIDFTKRLLEKRINYFSDNEIDFLSYFDTKSFKNSNVYKVLFEVSMNAPRILGYILDYCYEDKVNNGKSITITDIQSASQRYYEECVEVFFEKTKASKMAYDDKINILQQRELLNLILKELNVAKKYFYEAKGFTYASHFYLNTNLERFLKTLELNFFITKYLELSDRDGQKSSIYAINFGLANRENIQWGRPDGTEHRKYFINRQFDFNSLITSFLHDSSTIHCSNKMCKHVYEQDELAILEKYGMRCMKCGKENSVIETKVLDKLEDELDEINPDSLLNPSEVDIIYVLRSKSTPQYAKDIAGEVDLTSKSVGMRNKYLDENKGLINRQDTGQGKIYTLSDKARSLYGLK
ncbi:hypothetical protein [Acinetobacter calcoaceticus]|uniref:hypothetical protein n=1 Tax=Acinetobacter calcoaceticus TaxID=471 RepID=UPI003AF4F067